MAGAGRELHRPAALGERGRGANRLDHTSRGCGARVSLRAAGCRVATGARLGLGLALRLVGSTGLLAVAAAPVVVDVEAAALEDARRWAEQLLNFAIAVLVIAGLQGFVAEALPHFEDATALLAFILVDRHRWAIS